jgi:hypothetical protein
MSTHDETTSDRENRLCCEAQEQGLLLVKAGTHNKDAAHYGRYVLVPDKAGNRRRGAQAVRRAFADGEGKTLDEIAAELGVTRRSETVLNAFERRWT